MVYVFVYSSIASLCSSCLCLPLWLGLLLHLHLEYSDDALDVVLFPLDGLLEGIEVGLDE